MMQALCNDPGFPFGLFIPQAFSGMNWDWAEPEQQDVAICNP